MAFWQPEKDIVRSAKPILVCTGTHEEHEFPTGNELFTRQYLPRGMRGAIEDLAIPGKNAFRFSSVDASSKSARAFVQCTGLFIVGKKRGAKEEISFGTHELTLAALGNGFEHAFQKTAAAFLKKVDLETVDALMFGGKCIGKDRTCGSEYQESVHVLSDIFERTFGFAPAVAAGPNMAEETLDVYFDTQERRMYLVRPPQPPHANNSHSFPADAVGMQNFFEIAGM